MTQPAMNVQKTPDCFFVILTVASAGFVNFAVTLPKNYKFAAILSRTVDSVWSDDLFMSTSKLVGADLTAGNVLAVAGATPFVFPLVQARLLSSYKFPCGFGPTVYFSCNYVAGGNYQVMVMFSNDVTFTTTQTT